MCHILFYSNPLVLFFNSRPFPSIKSSNSLPNRFTYIYINYSSLKCN